MSSNNSKPKTKKVAAPSTTSTATKKASNIETKVPSPTTSSSLPKPPPPPFPPPNVTTAKTKSSKIDLGSKEVGIEYLKKQMEIEKQIKIQQRKIQRQSQRISAIRYIILFIVLGYYIEKHLRVSKILLPHGPAKQSLSQQPQINSFRSKINETPNTNTVIPSIDMANTALQIHHGHTKHIYERSTGTDSTTIGSKPILLERPEVVLVDPKDNTILYAITDSGKLLRLSDLQQSGDNSTGTVTANVELIKTIGTGKPLGAVITYSPTNQQQQQQQSNKRDNKNTNSVNSVPTIYITTAGVGLQRIVNFLNPKAKVELVATHVRDQKQKQQEETPILYANGITISTTTGKVYFTDSTNIAPNRLVQKQQQSQLHNHLNEQKQENNERYLLSSERKSIQYAKFYWDTMYTSLLDFIRGYSSSSSSTALLPYGTGRLIEYDPSTESIRVVAQGLYFASGIAMVKGDEDEGEHLVLSESFSRTIYKYNIQNDQFTVLVNSNELPAYPDGITCSPSSSSCFVLLKYPIVPISNLFNRIPEPINHYLRTILMTLPQSILLTIMPVQRLQTKFAGFLQINTTSGNDHRFYFDPIGHDFNQLTSITCTSSSGSDRDSGSRVLYFGSSNNYVGTYKFAH